MCTAGRPLSTYCRGLRSYYNSADQMAQGYGDDWRCGETCDRLGHGRIRKIETGRVSNIRISDMDKNIAPALRYRECMIIADRVSRIHSAQSIK